MKTTKTVRAFRFATPSIEVLEARWVPAVISTGVNQDQTFHATAMQVQTLNTVTGAQTMRTENHVTAQGSRTDQLTQRGGASATDTYNRVYNMVKSDSYLTSQLRADGSGYVTITSTSLQESGFDGSVDVAVHGGISFGGYRGFNETLLTAVYDTRSWNAKGTTLAHSTSVFTTDDITRYGGSYESSVAGYRSDNYRFDTMVLADQYGSEVLTPTGGSTYQSSYVSVYLAGETHSYDSLGSSWYYQDNFADASGFSSASSSMSWNAAGTVTTADSGSVSLGSSGTSGGFGVGDADTLDGFAKKHATDGDDVFDDVVRRAQDTLFGNLFLLRR